MQSGSTTSADGETLYLLYGGSHQSHDSCEFSSSYYSLASVAGTAADLGPSLLSLLTNDFNKSVEILPEVK